MLLKVERRDNYIQKFIIVAFRIDDVRFEQLSLLIHHNSRNSLIRKRHKLRDYDNLRSINKCLMIDLNSLLLLKEGATNQASLIGFSNFPHKYRTQQKSPIKANLNREKKITTYEILTPQKKQVKSWYITNGVLDDIGIISR